MITYIKPISFLFRIIRRIRIYFFLKIWLSIFFSLGGQAIFSQFEEISRLRVVTSGEFTYMSSRLRVVTSGIRVKVEDKKCSQTLSLGNFGLSLWFDMKLTKSSFIIHAQWYSLGIGGISCF